MKIAFAKLPGSSGKSLTNGNLLYELSNPYGKLNAFVLYGIFSLLFIGFKFWLIRVYGNATPFWDQWDAEAAGLYQPLFDGSLTWKHIVANHNEHRIVTTRLLALLLLLLNKTWNPLLQMVVNAGLHLIAVLLFNVLLTKVTGRNNLTALLAFSLILFSVPYGWENSLVGFQAQFYFVLLFSIASIWLMVSNEPFHKRWWAGIGVGVLAFFSLASGVFVFFTGMLVGLVAYLLKLRKTPRQLLACAVLGALFVTGVLLTPMLPHQAVYKAHSLADFYHSLKIVLSWPVYWNLLAAVIRNLPIGIFIVFMLWKRPAINDNRWFLFALCAWSLIQALSIAYGRAAGPLAPRYKDLHIIPIFISFACCFPLIQESIGKKRNYAVAGFIAWTAIILISIGNNSLKYLPGELKTKRQWNMAEEKNTRNYILTGNINYLKNTRIDMDIPYPNADRLAEILQLPGVRNVLPSNINRPLSIAKVESTSPEAFAVNGFNHLTHKQTDTAWGSYTAKHDSAVGSITLQFNMPSPGRKIEIPVAGNPFDKDMSFQIEQDGQVTPLKISGDPTGTWAAAYAVIKSKTFSIHATDSSTASWIAIAPPRVLGRLDGITTRLLDHYDIFLIMGVVIAMLLIALTGLNYRQRASLKTLP